MATNKQRREAERLRLQRQLEQRRQREASRRTFTLIASVVSALAVVALVIVVIVVATGDDGKKGPKKTDAAGPGSTTPAASTPAPQCGQEQFPTEQVSAAEGAGVTFKGVTVKGAADLKGKPGVSSHASAAPKKLQYKDLVVGNGAAAGPSACVTVQYDGALYKNGTEFDSSWSRGQLAQFSLQQVVPGFTQGIGGTAGVPPMKVGGRRVMILPAALGYGAKGSPPKIPANAPLVFVVDLVKVSS